MNKMYKKIILEPYRDLDFLRLAYPALAGGVIPDEVDMDDLSVLAEHADHVALRQLVGQAANKHPRRVLKIGKSKVRETVFWILISSVADPVKRKKSTVRGTVF
jgi:hypothetical protein